MLLICIKSLQSVTESCLCHHFNPIGMKVKALHFFHSTFMLGIVIFLSVYSLKRNSLAKYHFNILVGGSKNNIQAHCSGRVFKGVLKFSALEVCLKDVWHLIFLLRIFY